jgi:MFS transporter, MHS family, shikimate and dehydroshikimate transport protein
MTDMSTVERVRGAEMAAGMSGMRRILVSSVIGTAVEWYDFLIYGTASAIVFTKLFFPSSDPSMSAIASFGTLGVGYFARPLGAAVFGHFGDRFGRKAMLAMTIVIMGLGTFLIGLLPTYDQIGVAAPLLLVLLRLLQGVGLGGEWGGAVLMVVENAPTAKRGLLGSAVQLGYPFGTLAATGMFALLGNTSDASFLTWAWRVPFLVAILLSGVGLYIRLQLEETPAFRQLQAERRIAKLPLADVLTKEPRAFFTAIGLKLSEISYARRLRHQLRHRQTCDAAQRDPERGLHLLRRCVCAGSLRSMASQMLAGRFRPLP